MTYSALQQKGFELAQQLAGLPLEERLGIIARTFGCETAQMQTSACTGKWSGYTDISLVLDNGSSLWAGTLRTPQARADEGINDCVNNVLARYHPDIVTEAKELAAVALLARESADNKAATQKGLKPYTFLNVELCDGKNERSGGFLGWYYVTLAVDGKVFGLLESGLATDIYRGEVSEQGGKSRYHAAGGIPTEDVDFVFHNTGFSSFNGIYLCGLSDDALARAKNRLAERESEKISKVAPIHERKPSLLGKLEQNKLKVAMARNGGAAKSKEREV